MNKYIKKPVVVEAEELIPANIIKIANWITETNNVSFKTDDNDNIVGLIIPTLEGDMTASMGDYIIKGVAGEFYPCKSDIFNKTYSKHKDEVNSIDNIGNNPFNMVNFKDLVEKQNNIKDKNP